MYGQASGIGSFANRFELLLHPGQGFCEQDSRFLCCCTSAFLQFGTQGSDRAAAARQGFTVLNLDVYKSAEALLGELALLMSCNRFLNREMRSSTMAPPISSLVLK
jgi:hypothetical protein